MIIHLGPCSISGANCLSNYKIFDWSKLKAFTDDNLHVVQSVQSTIIMVIKNTVGKRENASYQHIFFQVFFPRVVKSHNCVVQD